MYLKKNYDIRTQISNATPDLTQLSKYIYSLQQDINNLHRELTYWDLYKITKVITSEDTFAATVNELAPCESAVINLTDKQSMTYNNVLYARGDLIVKLSDNTTQHIKSLNSGIYTPEQAQSSPSGGNTYIIPYHFSPDTPQSDSETIEIHLQGTNSTNIYDIRGNISTLFNNNQYTFSAKIVQNAGQSYAIRPFIRFYTDNAEIIDLPLTLTLTNNQWTITLLSSDSIATIIQVK